MANFFDLPRPIRDTIYRLHQVHADPTTREQHNKNANHKPGPYGRAMPALLAVSKKAEREAAHIYYGENHFDMGEVRTVISFGYFTYPRHLRLIRKVTCSWDGMLAGEGFQAIARMKNLHELRIRVDEASIVRRMLPSRKNNRYIVDSYKREPTAQEQLSIVRYPGYTGMLKICNVPEVEFIKTFNWKKEVVGGPIPGGFLETQVLPKLRGACSDSTVACIGLDDDCFPFLTLPAELRNRVYNLVLTVPGCIRPSADKPSSTPKNVPNRRVVTAAPESALGLLAVNKQINSESLGIFYHRNSFEFTYPIQLHAFLLNIGSLRLAYLRDITVYYQNSKSGGINLAELTFPMLKQLSGLRRLQVIMNLDLFRGIRRPQWWTNHSGWELSDRANPIALPGLKVLFTLRGITDIKVRDLRLEQDVEEAKKDKEYPTFSVKSRSACVVKLAEVLERFNVALANAQQGCLDKKILEDPEWHLKESSRASVTDDGMEEEE